MVLLPFATRGRSVRFHDHVTATSCRRLGELDVSEAIRGYRSVDVDCTVWWSFRPTVSSPVSIQTQSLRKKRNCFDRAFLLAGACVCCVKISRNKRKRQPIGMLCRSSGNHDWLLANASACVSCGFRLRTQRKRLRLNGNRA